MTTTAIKVRPMIFHARSIRAILDGAKTMTRRVVTPQPHEGFDFSCLECKWYAPTKVDRRGEGYPGPEVFGFADESHGWICPYGSPGERLWVRESFYLDHVDAIDCIPKERPADADEWLYYRADGECCDQIPECACAEIGKPKWRSPLHMPRWASRITLEITGVKVERLQDISEADAIAEGVGHGFTMNAGWSDYRRIRNGVCELTQDSARQSFGTAWDATNGHRKGCAWKDNPWVWAITFKVITPPAAKQS